MRKSSPFLLVSVGLLGFAGGDTITRTVTTVNAYANSIDDFAVSFPAAGVPDANGWNYGYYDYTNDPGGAGTYTASEFVQFTAGQTRGTGFGIAPSSEPWLSVGPNNSGHPEGANGSQTNELWAIRRYTVQPGVPAVVDLNWTLQSANGVNTGTTLNVYRNGNQIATATTSTTTGQSGVVPFSNLAVGDVIDFALSPEGDGGDRADGSDASNFGGFFGSTTTQTFTFETVGVIADSDAEFSGVQGANGWTNGYYNITTIGGIPTQASDFTAFATDGSTNLSNGVNHWNGTIYDFAGNPPWTEISAGGGHPNGTNNTEEHWATRRYEIQPGEDGDLFLEYNLSAANTGGTGTSLHVILNGTILDTLTTSTAAGEDGWLELNGVQVGDIIDFALSPSGVGDPITGASDGADGSNFDATIHLLVPEPATGSLLGLSAAVLLLRRRRK